MSCLTIVQNACSIIGIPSPSAIVTSQDDAIRQLLALLNKEGKELEQCAENGWQALTLEATFTTLAATSQGSLNTIAPNYKFILNDTIWNATQRRRIIGLSPQQWKTRQGLFPQGAFNEYRIQRNNINFIPAPAAGQTCYFEYVTKAWVTDSTGVTSKLTFTADTDVSLLDENLLELGLIWRWKHAKGLDYAEDFNTYMRNVDMAIASDVPREILALNRKRTSIFGNDNVPYSDFPSV